MGGGEGRQAVAFAPSHVTGIFAPSLTARDPRGRGSVGAGIVLELGVRATARYRVGGRARVCLTSDLGRRLEISEEVAKRLLGAGPGRLDIHLTHDLPVGQGFGSSAAGATATALAAARLFGRPRLEAVQVAHLADLFGGGGLGGVAAVLGGGLEVRVRPGIPPFGQVIHRPFPEALLVGVVGGPLPSPAILSSPRVLTRIHHAARGLDRLGPRPTTAEFFALSERFTDRVGLAPLPLRDVIRALRRRGAWAAQAMFGRSFFARPRSPPARREVLRWLTEHRIRAVELRAANRGANARSLGPS